MSKLISLQPEITTGTYAVTDDGQYVCYFNYRFENLVTFYVVSRGSDLYGPYTTSETSWEHMTVLIREKAHMLAAVMGRTLP